MSLFEKRMNELNDFADIQAPLLFKYKFSELHNANRSSFYNNSKTVVNINVLYFPRFESLYANKIPNTLMEKAMCKFYNIVNAAKFLRYTTKRLAVDEHLLDNSEQNYVCNRISRYFQEKSKFGEGYYDMSPFEYYTCDGPNLTVMFESVKYIAPPSSKTKSHQPDTTEQLVNLANLCLKNLENQKE